MSDLRDTAHIPHLLPGFVVGTLEPGEDREVRAHLTTCPDCRAEVVAWRAIQEALRDPTPVLSSDDGVLQEVWRRIDATPGSVRAAAPVALPVVTHGHARSSQPRAVAPRAVAVSPADPPLLPRPWVRAWAAMSLAAILLLMVLGVGVLTVGPGRAFLHRYLPTDRAVTLPAPGLEGAESEELLVRVTVPSDMVPAGENVRSCLSHIVIPPRTRAAWDANDAGCCPGTRLNYVLKGTFVARPEADVQVIRADRTSETVRAGAEVRLAAGDTLVLGSDTPYRTENPDDTSTELLQYILAYPPDFPRGTASLKGWTELDYDYPDIPVPEGPVTMTLYRFTLAPGAVLSSPPGLPLMQVVLPPGSASDAPFAWSTVYSTIAPSLESEITNSGRTPVTVYVLALEPQGGMLMPP